jgi:hypothetical protein
MRRISILSYLVLSRCARADLMPIIGDGTTGNTLPLQRQLLPCIEIRERRPPSIPNLQPRFNACPTDPAGTIETESASWPRCGGVSCPSRGKPLKELRLATFDARVETVTTKPSFKKRGLSHAGVGLL